MKIHASSLPFAFLPVAMRVGCRKLSLGLIATLLLQILLLGRTLYAEDFFCEGDATGEILEAEQAGDCIRAAITTANSSGEANTIFLDEGPGSYLFSGGIIASVTGPFPLTIIGPGPQKLLRVRNPSGRPALFIGPQASLTLQGLTISVIATSGEQIRNEGHLEIVNAEFRGSDRSGISNAGTASITNTTIRENESGIENSGSMTITNSTIANNNGGLPVNPDAAGISNTGTLNIVNSTVALNVGLGVSNSGSVQLQNTIVALNNRGGPDCMGVITSLGNNLFGNPMGCAVSLQPTDLTGDPGLGQIDDNGPAGRGYLPLLETSQAIDRGNNEICSSDPLLATDQTGKPRSVASTPDGPRICDIGAVEFFPIVNSLVQVRDLATQLDPTPVSSGPAGRFFITATFENISDQTIFFPFFEVAAIERDPATGGTGPVLLNADGSPGRVGARLTPEGSLDTPFERGTARTFEFIIGLFKQNPFTFFVNMLGEPRSSAPPLTMGTNTR